MPSRRLLAASEPRTRDTKRPLPCAQAQCAQHGGAARDSLVAEELVPLDPHMREARLAKAERARRGGRDVDDPPADERPSVDDFQDGAAAIVEIDHLHPRSHGKGFVRGDQPAVMWILIVRGYTQLTCGRYVRKSKNDRAHQHDFLHSLHLIVPNVTKPLWRVDEAKTRRLNFLLRQWFA